jgi:hypothetical protein
MRPHIGEVVVLIGVLGLVGPEWVTRPAGAQRPSCPCYESEDVVELVGDMPCALVSGAGIVILRRQGRLIAAAEGGVRSEPNNCAFAPIGEVANITDAQVGVCVAELQLAAAKLRCDRVSFGP